MPSTLRLFLVGALTLGAVVSANPAVSAQLPAVFDPHLAAVDVARAIGDGDLRQLDHLIVVTDTQAADAVSAAGLAGYLDNSGRTGRTAVLLTSPTTLPAPTAQAITDSGVSAERIYVVGGTAAVADSVRDAIARAAGWNGTGASPVQRIAGVDRYATAAAVLDHVRSAHGAGLPESYRTVVVTNGEHLSDALSAGSLAYTHGHLVVLSPAHAAPPITIDALSSFDARCALLVGGPAALSAQVSEQVNAALGENDCAPRMHGSNRRTTSIAVADHTVTTSRVPTEVFLAPDFATPLTAAAAPLARRHRVILSTHTGSLSEEVRNWLRQHRPMRVDVVPGAGTHFIDTSVLADARASRLSTNPDTAAGPTPDPDPTPDPATSVRFSIETTSADQTFELPLRGTVDVIIDWGDGGANACTRRVTTSGNVPCTFAQVGTYDIAIGRGSDTGPWLTQLGDGDTTYPGVNVITAVQSFGDLGIESLSGFLHGGGNPTMPADIPSTVTDLSFMFRNATTFNQNIGNWNTSNVTDMSFMFSNTGAFNQPIGNWDLAQVTDLHHMFSGASAFNRNLSAWNTASVVNMAGVFAFATAFNNGCVAGVTTCPLQWDTSAVESMFEMFRNASVFNQDINNDADGNWKTANVTDFERMFENATAFNQNLSGWCVGGVGAVPFNFASGTPAGFTADRQPQWGTCPEPASSLSLTIHTTTANQTMALPLRGTVNVTIDWGDNGANTCPTSATSGGDITCTYATAGTYTIAVRPGSGPGPWLTGFGPANAAYTGVNLITAIHSFGELGIQSLSGLLRAGGNPTVPSVLPATVNDLSFMFALNKTFNRDISGWDTSSVTDVWSMFAHTVAFNQNLSDWNTANVVNMTGVFAITDSFNNGCSIGTDSCPLNWDTSNVTDMKSMFERATVFNQDIGSWDTSKVTNMSWMFREASAFNRDITSWDTANVTDMSNMFAFAHAFNQDLSSWCVTKITAKPSDFDINTTAWDTTARQPVWGTCPEPASSLSLTIHTTTANQTMDLPIRGAVNVTIDWGDNGANDCPTSVISTNNLLAPSCTYATAGTYNIAVRPGSGPGPWLTQFGAGYSFPGINLITAIHSFGELGIQSLYGLLYGGGNPTMPEALPPTVTSLWAMFAVNTNFNRDISNWDTSNVTDMRWMFGGATAFNQNLSAWDTSKVTNMDWMFDQASSFNNGCAPGVTTCPLHWDTGAVVSMDEMFKEASVFNQDIGSWNTSNVTNLRRMFREASAFNQNLSAWDTSKVTNFFNMFPFAESFNNGCPFDDPSCPLTWDTSEATDMDYMFWPSVSFNQDISTWCVTKIPNEPLIFASGTPAGFTVDRQPKWGTCPEPASSLSLTIHTTTANQTMALPLRGTVNVTIDWGDNGANNCPTSAISAANVTCTYATAGTYTIAVRPGSGPGPWLTQFGTGDSFPGTDLITAIHSFGELGIQSLYGLLYGGGNPTMPAALPPTVTSLWAMFALNTSFNRNISGWNTSNVIDMTAVFLGATSFNQNLSSWDTSQVVNFMDTFSGASAFNNGCSLGDGGCPLTWDTSEATMMIGTFEQATVFNQDIRSWDTSKATDMTRMFSNASAFNQDLSSWCVSLVGTTPFNFDINTTAWDKTARQPVWGTCPATAP